MPQRMLPVSLCSPRVTTLRGQTSRLPDRNLMVLDHQSETTQLPCLATEVVAHRKLKASVRRTTRFANRGFPARTVVAQSLSPRTGWLVRTVALPLSARRFRTCPVADCPARFGDYPLCAIRF